MNAKSIMRLRYHRGFRRISIQVIACVLLVAFIVYIIGNTQTNLKRLNITPGFDFMSDIAGFLATYPNFNLTGYDINTSTHLHVFLTGLVNTVIVAVVGIVFATILGFIVGILRLSQNVLINFLASAYVELMRNVPLLLWILIWYFAVILSAPSVRKSFNLFDTIFINQRYITAPSATFHEGIWLFNVAIFVAIVAIVLLRRWRKKRLHTTGKYHSILLPSLGILFGLPLLALVVAGFPVTWEMPVLKGFNFQGGIQLPAQYVAMVVALSVYTAAYIGELVRAGIMSVNRGQLDASKAIGLQPGEIMRLVVIPQALRVIIPPLTSQYLNLTKNTSLAVAIGYMDIVNVFAGVSLMQTGNALEIILLTMLVYASLSLMISLIMNVYNRRMAIVER